MEGRRAVSAIECGYLGGKEKADRKAKSETGQTNINFGQQGGGARPQQNSPSDITGTK